MPEEMTECDALPRARMLWGHNGTCVPYEPSEWWGEDGRTLRPCRCCGEEVTVGDLIMRLDKTAETIPAPPSGQAA